MTNHFLHEKTSSRCDAKHDGFTKEKQVLSHRLDNNFLKRPHKVIFFKILVSKMHIKSHDSHTFKWKDRILNSN